MAGPEDETATAEGCGRGGLRASDADREQVIGTLKAAFVQGRLTEDELGERVDRVYAARTYTALAEVIADLPTALTRARSTRSPWRTTKMAWWFEYGAFTPGIVAIVVIAAASVAAAIVVWQPDNYPAFALALFTGATLILAPPITVGLMIDARHQRRSGGRLSLEPALNAGR